MTKTRRGRLSASQGSKPSPRANRGGNPNVDRPSVIDVRMVESRDRSESSCDSTRQLQDQRHGSDQHCEGGLSRKNNAPRVGAQVLELKGRQSLFEPRRTFGKSIRMDVLERPEVRRTSSTSEEGAKNQIE